MFSSKKSSKRSQGSTVSHSDMALFEMLEGRQMYSATPLSVATTHAVGATAAAPLNMTLNCGSNNETVCVGQSGSTVAVEVNGTTKYFSNIGAITINANSGSDEILIARTMTDKVTINAGTGNDLIVTGASNDTINGGTGNSIFVAFGGKNNRLVAGKGYTNIWDTAGNTIVRGTGQLVCHSVNGLLNTSDMKLDGSTFTEPATNSQTQDTGGWVNVSSLPLFSKYGPTMNDISQGELGTCYFLSSLGSIAMQDPQHIRNLITPLGDGTYLEQFINGGKAYYVRIDGYLPYTQSATNLEYAHLGQGNSTWVPLMEKGWAYFHSAEQGKAFSYGAVEGGLGAPTLYALGGQNVVSTSTPTQVFANGDQMLAWIDQQLQSGKAVNLGFAKDVAGQIYGEHEYSAVEVVYNQDGSIAGIWVHNPWGVDLSTGMASYGHNDGYNDGYVFITADVAFYDTMDLAAATV